MTERQAKTPLERAAYALCIADGKSPGAYRAHDIEGQPFNGPDTNPNWMEYLSAAKAVFGAISEPSATMIGWGSDAIKDLGQENERAAAQATWRAMIQAALQE
ncbi:hypothetical protein [Croceibacterium mercuriale]|uniref:hypothetical protein n=1 Tax=Croceibacterium mercuriale TaxID=1572751 RepID=UPI00126A3FAC|nr:hypothetical protein [Croceibacterium mercuriale]